jgi:hypothetical protein
MTVRFHALLLGVFLVLGGQPGFAQSAAPSAAPAPQSGGIVVEPTVKRPKPPDGDPRSNDERREDRIAFDKCMLRMQGRPEETLSNPGLPPDPLFYCQQRLGMANAYDVPQQTRAKQH